MPRKRKNRVERTSNFNFFRVMRRPHPHNRVVLRKMDSRVLSGCNSNSTLVAFIIVIISVVVVVVVIVVVRRLFF